MVGALVLTFLYVQDPVQTPFPFTDVKVGSGKAAGLGDRVTVHLHVRTEDGKVIVDSVKRRQTYTFLLKARPDQKWTEAVVGMKPGGVRRIRLTPEQGWGKTGNPPVVPPDATLVVTVTVKAVTPSE
ncbi:MAG: FKBP-type peptidyl-prolyl cis-trans isomerase [Armatimonadetes bacterium]|nr:FKBP-type peptidyl-prolyl cis-trans isomerase [Armatimonadota bacterium]